MAIKKEFLIRYFSLPDNNFDLLLKQENYLWGYGRILAWYSEFESIENEFQYSRHFREILQYLLSTPKLPSTGSSPLLNPHPKSGSLRERAVKLRNKKPDAPPSTSYIQNAFLSLIYLLTFRETNHNFCIPNSEEFKLAEEVIELYKGFTVKLKRISTDKSLNKYFEELLYGNSSAEDLENLLQV
ncbi:MAG: hypothetical protein LH629_10030, partial [Ignavibacteria bacterium]|nr:hypothetical protein [Ignavibacteria bacterium]